MYDVLLNGASVGRANTWREASVMFHEFKKTHDGEILVLDNVPDVNGRNTQRVMVERKIKGS